MPVTYKLILLTTIQDNTKTYAPAVQHRVSAEIFKRYYTWADFDAMESARLETYSARAEVTDYYPRTYNSTTKVVTRHDGRKARALTMTAQVGP
jgi:hypothetical protein